MNILFKEGDSIKLAEHVEETAVDHENQPRAYSRKATARTGLLYARPVFD